MFSEILQLIGIVYMSTAERTFSALRRLKTFLRSTMTQPRFNHAMSVYVHEERMGEIDVDEVANSFVSVNERSDYFCLILFDIIQYYDV